MDPWRDYSFLSVEPEVSHGPWLRLHNRHVMTTRVALRPCPIPVLVVTRLHYMPALDEKCFTGVSLPWSLKLFRVFLPAYLCT